MASVASTTVKIVAANSIFEIPRVPLWLSWSTSGGLAGNAERAKGCRAWYTVEMSRVTTGSAFGLSLSSGALSAITSAGRCSFSRVEHLLVLFALQP